MKPNDIFVYSLAMLDNVVLAKNWGEWGIFYNPNKVLKKGVYILTIKEQDGENDKSSNLQRNHVYRMNICLRKETFIKRFGFLPKRPLAGGVVKMDFDFTALDVIMPHPVYAWMGWICVLNPSDETFEELKSLILESHEFAKEKFSKRKM